MARLIQFGAIAVILGWLIPNLATTYIEPDEIGVRRSLLSGVAHKDLAQGRAFSVPFLHTIYRLPSTLHYQLFVSERALSLRTRENNVIDVDVTVIYEIVPNEAHLIVEEGFIGSYETKVSSITQGFLREQLATLSSEDVQLPSKREAVATGSTGPINKLLAQYHVRVPENGVVLRAIRFRPEYEQKLQDKQLYAVQARLDEAKGKEAEAATLTDTDSKGIDRDVKLEAETWNTKIEEAKTVFEIEIADVNALALRYDREKRAAADALCSKALAEGNLAEAKADALGEKLKAQALSTPAGRTYSAIEAARNFKLGDILLNSQDPAFLRDFGSMDAWRKFFLSGSSR
ncbi:MAG: SPFH domain-containing protein [Deltaproteobacteria bacterium]|nr:SPFH domain-containing protein [Deltaproteobacteria bacterium]